MDVSLSSDYLLRMRGLTYLILLCVFCFAGPVLAEPVPYELDLKKSEVVFSYALGSQDTKGVFPIASADTVVDLTNVRRSTLDVKVATKFVRAGDPFVTLAIRGPELLATGKHPYARFVSTSVIPSANGAKIVGDLTLKGVTRPVTLDAVFQRRADAPKDNSELILMVSGSVSRSDFGVVGFPDLVGDEIVLRFMVHLLRK